MDHMAILRWVLNADKQPSYLEFDEDILIRLISIHNLSGRFIKKIQDHKVPLFSQNFIKSLREMHLQTKKQVINNIDSVRQIIKQLPFSTELVIIKGFSTYVLTGCESTMRSGDIDLLSNNPKLLVEILNKMGFEQTRDSFLHELGEYTKGEIELDIHNYFPVYSYTAPLLNTNLLPHKNSGTWNQSHKMKHVNISINDILEFSHIDEIANTLNIRVADPNVLALIICAHSFMNYTNMWSISHREKAYVRLSEIADLFDLVRHPKFDNKKFLSLVKRFEAIDSVEWVANITSSLLGQNPLPIHSSVSLNEELPIERFPRCLWWGFWANIPSGTDELIQNKWLSMKWLTNELGFNKLVFNNETTGEQATFNDNGSRVLGRLLTQKMTPIPLILEVSESKYGITVYLKVLSKIKADIERIRIDFGHVASELIYEVDNKQQSLVGAPAKINIREQCLEYEIWIKFTWNTLKFIQEEMKICMLIGVGKQSVKNGLIDSILIPLVVHR